MRFEDVRVGMYVRENGMEAKTIRGLVSRVESPGRIWAFWLEYPGRELYTRCQNLEEIREDEFVAAALAVD